MSEFENATTLKRPDEITKSRFINPKNQMSKVDAHILAQKNGIVWGAK